MPGLGDLLQLILQQAQPQPQLGQQQPTGTFAGRVVHPGTTIAEVLSRLPQESPDAEGLGTAGAIVTGAGSLAKIAAKAVPEELSPLNKRVQQLVKDKLPMPVRQFLIPTVKTPTGELIQGAIGENHPIEKVISHFTEKGQAVPGNIKWGFVHPDHPQAFIPDTLQDFLASTVPGTKQGRLKSVADMLKAGVSEDTITDILRENAPLVVGPTHRRFP